MLNKYKLQEVCDLSIGYVGTVTSQYEDNGIPFLRTLNIKPYNIIDNDLKTINKDFHLSQKKSILYKDDIAMVHTGVPGICAVIPEKFNDSNCIDMIVIKPKKEMIDSQFLCAYMNTIGYKHILKKQVGCIQKHFNLSDAQNLEVFIPEIELQKKIGTFVKNINDKIECNNIIIDRLSEIIKSLFDRYFLQFDFPTNEYKSYKKDGGKFEYNELLKREIPIGWKVIDLESVCNIFTGKKDVNQALEKGKYKFYSCSPDFKYSNEKIFSGKAILISGNGSYTGRTIFVDDSFDLYQRTYACTSKKNNNLTYYYYYLLRFFVPNVMGGTHGSAIPYIVYNDIAKLKIMFNEETITKFNKISEPIQELIVKLEKENIDLTKIRETNLPLLLNGQLIIK